MKRVSKRIKSGKDAGVFIGSDELFGLISDDRTYLMTNKN